MMGKLTEKQWAMLRLVSRYPEASITTAHRKHVPVLEELRSAGLVSLALGKPITLTPAGRAALAEQRG